MLFKLKIVFQWLKLKSRKVFSSQEHIEVYQQKKLQLFAEQVLVKSPFYKPYIKPHMDWNKVPHISKATFMDAFNEINTCGIKLNDAMQIALDAETSRSFNQELNGITIGLSTGTSGKRGLFLVSENERALWVALVMSRVIKPRLFKKQKIAFFLRANSNLYASVSSSLFEFKYFDIFKPLTDLLQELQTFSPHILAAQPSLLVDIAQAQHQQIIQINPNQIISFAEVLHAHDKAFISQKLQASITEVYQCTEGFLGVSCQHGTMHLNEDFIRFEKEWIDDDKFYPIITDFSRRSQPVVKYKLNDVLQIKSTPCACGSPLLALEKIMGRDDDILVINEQKIYPDLIARRIAIQTNNFQNYTITQIGQQALEIKLECEEKDAEITQDAFKKAINELLKEHGINSFSLEFKMQQVRVPGNKLRKIIRAI